MTGEPGRKPTVARADLMRALESARTPAEVRERAALLGYRSSRAEPTVSLEVTHRELPPKARPQHFDVPLWRTSRVEFSPVAAAEEVPTTARKEGELRREEFGRLEHPPESPVLPALVPWAQLRRALEQVWRCERAIGGVDVDALVRTVSMGAPVVSLPRAARAVPVSRLIVVVDRSERLLPFWSDQLGVFPHLERELGAQRVRIAVWGGGPPARTPRLAEGDVVLVIGDLGHYAGPAVREAWSRFGAKLRQEGARCAALLPVPVARWVPGLVRGWRAIDWSQPTRRAARAGPTPGALDRRRDDLLALVSWTVRTEPSLLRDARACFSATEFDLGTEADLWNHPELVRHSGGLLLPMKLRRMGQARLPGLLANKAWRQAFVRFVDVVRQRHASQPQELWMEEIRTLELLGLHEGSVSAEERETMVRFTHRLQRLFEDKEEQTKFGDELDILGWSRRALEQRMPERGWSHPTLGPALLSTFRQLHRDEPERALPPGTSAPDLEDPAALGESRGWVVRQRGKTLRFTLDTREAYGSPLWHVVTRARWVSVAVSGQPSLRACVLDPVEGTELVLPAGEAIALELHGTRAHLELGSTPSWARAAGRDRFGAWASFEIGGVEQRMRWIPPGSFWMGSPETELGRWNDEGPRHLVMLTHGYWLAETPCTQDLWRAVVGTDPSHFEGGTRPVEQVSWEDVNTSFLARLNDAIPPDTESFRLPSEAEWEYACRAATSDATYAGDLSDVEKDPALDGIAWYGANSSETVEVGQKPPNLWGLHDMLGNVREWCADMNSNYELSPQVNPFIGHGRDRVSRGGGWAFSARFVRAAYRNWRPPGDRYGALGFRLARGQNLQELRSSATSHHEAEKQGRKQGRGTRPA